MNLRSLLASASLLASMALPAAAGAQVTFHAGVRVGTPPPPVVVVQQPQPQVVVVQRPQPQPIFVGRPGRFRGRRHVVVQTPSGVYVERGRGRHGRRH